MAIEYFAGDERPYWQPTIEIEGAAEDYSSGYTFEVTIGRRRGVSIDDPVVTKSSGINGFPAGLVVVAWAVGELAIAPSTEYAVQLRVIRTSDGRDFTIEDDMTIKARMG